mmetsp:Transcript_250/g.287  ORF Transcript_250/g.287 Transcript_250/m.287 type:complete len:93 (+) Transcript_250:576-854(+)
MPRVTASQRHSVRGPVDHEASDGAQSEHESEGNRAQIQLPIMLRRMAGETRKVVSSGNDRKCEAARFCFVGADDQSVGEGEANVDEEWGREL